MGAWRPGRIGRASTRRTPRPRSATCWRDSGAQGPGRRGPGTGRQGARGARGRAPTWSGSSTSSRAASGTATTTRSCCRWEDFLELGAQHRDEHPDALAERMAASRTRRPRDVDLHVRHHRAAERRDADRRQRRVRDQVLVRGGRVHRPAARPARRDAVLPAAVPRRRADLHAPGSTRPPAPRSTSPSRSRRCRRTCARCSRRSCSASRGSGRSCWPASTIRLCGASWAQAAARPVLAQASRTASANSWCAPAAGTRPEPAALRDRLAVLLPRAQGPHRHAEGPVRRLGCGADRTGGAAASSWASACRCTRSTA